MRKLAPALTTAISMAAIALINPPLALAQTQPTPTALPPDTLLSLVNQVSDMLASTLNTGSCQDLSGILSKVPTTAAGTAPDPNSMFGQVLLSVKNDPKLKSIVVTKVGPPLITKLIDCNMVPLDALTSPSSVPSSTTPSSK